MNEPFREWLYFGDLQNEPGNYQLFKEIWFNEKPCVICIRTGKWSVCCTGSSISKMLSSWVSLASRRSCAFFWGMTATGSHGIRNRWRYAQDDKVFCYLRLPDKFQFRNSLWSRGPKDVGWPPSVRDALAAGPARQIPICLTVEAFGQYSCILRPGGKQARERHTQTHKLFHWTINL